MSTLNFLLTPGDDFLANTGPGNYDGTINALDGEDSIVLGGDYDGIFIGLDGGADALAVGQTGAATAYVRNSTVRAGQGQDNLLFLTSELRKNEIWLDDGNDRLVLSTRPLNPAGSTIIGNTFLGGEGTDAILVLNTVNKFNQNLVDLGGNDGTPLGGFADTLLDGLLGGTAFLDLIADGPITEYAYVAATEVFETTVRGGQGDDIIFFESFTGSPDTLDGDDLTLDKSLVNGNQGQDFIAIARNVDNNTSILGGQGNDNMVLLSGLFNDSRINGNQGADLLTVFTIESNRSTFFGGQGDDVIDVASATIFSSKISGDLGNDKINFLAAVSANTTLAGGEGDDEIDDFSSAITNIGNKLEGDAGDDTLRQAANIFASVSGGALNGVFDFAATFIGGTGADRMTGDLETQLLGKKQLNGGGDDVLGASSDTFQFAFGDSVINGNGTGRDIITDFDSNASRYLNNGTPSFNVPTNPFTDYNNPITANALTEARERDVIDLIDTNISINSAGLSGVLINSRGLVTSGVGNIESFVTAGASLTTRGAAILWNESPNVPTTAGNLIPPRSQLFISDGDGVLSSGDLLMQLNQVAGLVPPPLDDSSGNPFTATGGLIITGGDITDIRLA